jgi:hypothetical protein
MVIVLELLSNCKYGIWKNTFFQPSIILLSFSVKNQSEFTLEKVEINFVQKIDIIGNCGKLFTARSANERFGHPYQ